MDTPATDQAEVDEPPSGVVDLSERTWLPRHCRGDQQAFELLLGAYRKLVYTFLYRYGIDSQNRDDLFQDIFLKVHQSAPSYRPSEPLQPWLISKRRMILDALSEQAMTTGELVELLPSIGNSLT